MADGGTAQIIPFPRPGGPFLRASGPQTRLASALAGLQAALDQQHEAVATWRRNLLELQDSVQGLGTSLAGYRGRLGELRAGVGRLGAEAEVLTRVIAATD